MRVEILDFAFYCVIFFCVWKFYQILSKINGNLARIRGALEPRGDRPNGGEALTTLRSE